MLSVGCLPFEGSITLDNELACNAQWRSWKTFLTKSFSARGGHRTHTPLHDATKCHEVHKRLDFDFVQTELESSSNHSQRK